MPILTTINNLFTTILNAMFDAFNFAAILLVGITAIFVLLYIVDLVAGRMLNDRNPTYHRSNYYYRRRKSSYSSSSYRRKTYSRRRKR